MVTDKKHSRRSRGERVATGRPHSRKTKGEGVVTGKKHSMWSRGEGGGDMSSARSTSPPKVGFSKATSNAGGMTAAVDGRDSTSRASVRDCKRAGKGKRAPCQTQTRMGITVAGSPNTHYPRGIG